MEADIQPMSPDRNFRRRLGGEAGLKVGHAASGWSVADADEANGRGIGAAAGSREPAPAWKMVCANKRETGSKGPGLGHFGINLDSFVTHQGVGAGGQLMRLSAGNRPSTPHYLLSKIFSCSAVSSRSHRRSSRIRSTDPRSSTPASSNRAVLDLPCSRTCISR